MRSTGQTKTGAHTGLTCDRQNFIVDSDLKAYEEDSCIFF
ncbi:uncharacterized protein METZ01_LOCUS86021 [marine metagenome]|uniref:Uncharacterized protein n=1 Tax=marine metagenome TaxID=408172 RepID=A0A381V0L5_9ZZZZ